MTLGYDFSTQLRGVRQISPGDVVKPTGIGGGGRGWLPAAGAPGPYASQYDRAAEAPVPVGRVPLSPGTSRCVWMPISPPGPWRPIASVTPAPTSPPWAT